MKNKIVVSGVLISLVFSIVFGCALFFYDKQRNFVRNVIVSDAILPLHDTLRKCQMKNSILDEGYILDEQKELFFNHLVDVCEDQKCVHEVVRKEVTNQCSLAEKLKQRLKLVDLKDVQDSVFPDFKSLDEELEVVVVSGYEGEVSTELFLGRPGKKVLLILGAYKKHDWNIYVGLNSSLIGVISLGGHPQSIRSHVLIPKLLNADLGYVSAGKSMDMVRLLESLNMSYQIGRVDNFYGSYKLDSEYLLIDEPTRQEYLTLQGVSPTSLTSESTFYVVTAEFEPIKWTVNGPVKTTGGVKYRFVSDAFLEAGQDSFDLFQANGENVFIRNPYFSDLELPSLPDSYPNQNNPKFTSVTLDRENSKLIVLGENSVYFFDLNSEKWVGYKELELPFGFYKIAYDSAAKKFFMLFQQYKDHEPDIIEYDYEFNRITSYSLKDKLIEYYRVSYGNGPYVPSLHLVVNDQNLILVAIEDDQVVYIWNYNTISKNANLTYKNSLKSHPKDPYDRLKPDFISGPAPCRGDC